MLCLAGAGVVSVPTQIHLIMLLLRRYSVCVAQSTASLNQTIRFSASW